MNETIMESHVRRIASIALKQIYSDIDQLKINDNEKNVAMGAVVRLLYDSYTKIS